MKITALVFVLLIVCILALSSCFLQFRKSDRKAAREFQGLPNPISFHNYKFRGRIVHYAKVGNDQLPMVIFVHGSPGSWSAFEEFMKDEELLSKVHIISVDRLGYGQSGFGWKEESLERQADIFLPILMKNRSSQKPVLVGHSYGGPVIAKLAMDYPDLVGGLVFVAPSIDAALEPELWYQRPASWRIFRWLLPKALRVCNEEILALKPYLVEIIPDWKKIAVPVVFIQGGKDPLVDPGNAKFGEKMMKNAPLKMVYEEELNHFIPWTRPDLIKQGIKDIVEGRVMEEASRKAP